MDTLLRQLLSCIGIAYLLVHIGKFMASLVTNLRRPLASQAFSPDPDSQ